MPVSSARGQKAKMRFASKTNRRKRGSEKKKSSPKKTSNVTLFDRLSDCREDLLRTPVRREGDQGNASGTRRPNYYGSPIVRRLRNELAMQRSRAIMLENALEGVRKEREDVSHFEDAERKTLVRRVTELRRALRSTSGSPSKVRVKVPDDVVEIMKRRGFLDESGEEEHVGDTESTHLDGDESAIAENNLIPHAQNTPKETLPLISSLKETSTNKALTTKSIEDVTKISSKDAPQEQQSTREDVLVASLREQLNEMKQRTDTQRKALEVQLEELTAELMNHMERDAINEERDAALERLRKELKETRDELQTQTKRSEALVSSEAELRYRIEQAETEKREKSKDREKRTKLERVSWAREKAALTAQLDDLCDIVEEKELKESKLKKTEVALEAAKKELDEMRAYVLTYKTRSDRKIQQLRDEICGADDDIAKLDATLLKIQRMLQEIIKRGENKSMSFPKVLSTLGKIVNSLERQQEKAKRAADEAPEK